MATKEDLRDRIAEQGWGTEELRRRVAWVVSAKWGEELDHEAWAEMLLRGVTPIATETEEIVSDLWDEFLDWEEEEDRDDALDHLMRELAED